MSLPHTRLSQFLKSGDVLIDRTVLASPDHPVMVREAEVNGTVKLQVRDQHGDRRVELAFGTPIETLAFIDKQATVPELSSVLGLAL